MAPARALRLWLDVNGERRQACEAGAMCYAPTLVALAALCFGCAAFVCPRLPAVHLGEPLLREAILGCM